jgi:hypothetical protein
MEQKEHVNCQETIMFGKVDAFIETPISNNCADDTLLSDVRSSTAGIS